MKMRVYGVSEWVDDDQEQDASFSRMGARAVHRLMADEDKTKREDCDWWEKTICTEYVDVEGYDTDDIVENFNNEYCYGDFYVANELDGEVIEMEEE